MVPELFNAGDQVPEIPFIDVVGSGFKIPPEQMAATCVKVGVVGATIEMFNVWVVAHGFNVALGVNTYVPFAVVLTTAGDHVPTIPFGEVVAKTGGVLPEQSGAIAAKFGAIVVAQGVLHVSVCGVTQSIPLTERLKVTD